jgi:hypothetical protein
MTRYFFHVRHGTLDRDTEGIELPDQRAAWAEAVAACGEALKEMDGALKLPPEWRMEVADESDNTLFSLRISAEFYDQQ